MKMAPGGKTRYFFLAALVMAVIPLVAIRIQHGPAVNLAGDILGDLAMILAMALGVFLTWRDAPSEPDPHRDVAIPGLWAMGAHTFLKIAVNLLPGVGAWLVPFAVLEFILIGRVMGGIRRCLWPALPRKAGRYKFILGMLILLVTGGLLMFQFSIHAGLQSEAGIAEGPDFTQSGFHLSTGVHETLKTIFGFGKGLISPLEAWFIGMALLLILWPFLLLAAAIPLLLFSFVLVRSPHEYLIRSAGKGTLFRSIPVLSLNPVMAALLLLVLGMPWGFRSPVELFASAVEAVPILVFWTTCLYLFAVKSQVWKAWGKTRWMLSGLKRIGALGAVMGLMIIACCLAYFGLFLIHLKSTTAAYFFQEGIEGHRLDPSEKEIVSRVGPEELRFLGKLPVLLAPPSNRLMGEESLIMIIDPSKGIPDKYTTLESLVNDPTLASVEKSTTLESLLDATQTAKAYSLLYMGPLPQMAHIGKSYYLVRRYDEDLEHTSFILVLLRPISSAEFSKWLGAEGRFEMASLRLFVPLVRLQAPGEEKPPHAWTFLTRDFQTWSLTTGQTTKQTWRLSLDFSRLPVSPSVAAVFLIALAGILLYSVHLVRRIQTGLSELHEGTLKISGGDLNHTLAIPQDRPYGVLGRPRDDEFNVLASAFNKMTADMRAMLVQAGERERLQREFELAREIQQSLLPSSLPEIPGLRMAASTRMAEQVGGDFYAVYPIPGGVRILIGDVSGHGIGGALFMTVVTTLAEEMALSNLGHRDLMGKLDERLRSKLWGRRFVTCLVADLLPAEGKIVLTNAGHPPPLKGTPWGWVEVKPAESQPPLGTPFIGVYAEYSSELKPGDRLVFFTDGFPEAHPPGETGRLLGFDGFIGWLDPRLPEPGAAVEALFKRLDELSGGRLEDDATVFIADVV